MTWLGVIWIHDCFLVSWCRSVLGWYLDQGHIKRCGLASHGIDYGELGMNLIFRGQMILIRLSNLSSERKCRLSPGPAVTREPCTLRSRNSYAHRVTSVTEIERMYLYTVQLRLHYSHVVIDVERGVPDAHESHGASAPSEALTCRLRR